MIVPMVIPYRNGHVKLGSKIFSKGDVNAGYVMRDSLIQDPNWFGGRVYQFGKNATYKGLYLCMEGQIDDKGNSFPGDNVIGLYIRDIVELSPESKKLLQEEGIEVEEVTETPEIPTQVEEMTETPIDVVRAAETIAAVTDIVNKKLASRTRRESNPL